MTADTQGWRPIETAPRDGTHIIAYEGTGDMYRAAWSTHDECWRSFCGQPVVYAPEPEWWVPVTALPAPPSDAAP